MCWWITSTKGGLHNSKLYSTLSYLSFTIIRCISVSDFSSLFGIPIGILSSAIGLKVCGITAGIQKHKSIIKKKKKKHDKIVLLAKTKLNSKEAFF